MAARSSTRPPNIRILPTLCTGRCSCTVNGFLAAITDLFAETGKPDAEAAGRHFVMLRDGAMAAGCLTDPAPVCQTFLRGLEGLLTYRSSLAG